MGSQRAIEAKSVLSKDLQCYTACVANPGKLGCSALVRLLGIRIRIPGLADGSFGIHNAYSEAV